MPALSERENLDIEQLVKQVLLLHLTDDEIGQYLVEGIDRFEQARVDAHLERCLICARRVQTTREILALGDCEPFRLFLAEFSQFSKEDRARRMPELQAHLEGCPDCRQDYWAVTPLWRQALEKTRQTGNSIYKTLSESLDLALTEAGRLLQTGIGPLADLDQVVYASLSSSAGEVVPLTLAGDATVHKEWALTDDEAQCSIRLTVSGRNAEQVALCCEFESEPQAKVDPASARIEVRRVGDEEPLVSGPLSFFRGEPIVLDAGSWLIKLQVSSGQGDFIWEVPLTLSAVSEQGA
jgi:hypothetical protein